MILREDETDLLNESEANNKNSKSHLIRFKVNKKKLMVILVICINQTFDLFMFYKNQRN